MCNDRVTIAIGTPPPRFQSTTKTESSTQTTTKAEPKDSVPGGPENLTIDGISAIAVILIASFAIDRISTGVLFLLSFSKGWARRFPDPEVMPRPVENDPEDPDGTKAVELVKARRRAEKKQRLAYYTIAFVLGGVVLALYGKVTIFRAIGFKEAPFLLDCIMTGLILVAGADRLANMMKTVGAPVPESAGPSPIEITGKLILEGEGGRKVARAGGKKG